MCISRRLLHVRASILQIGQEQRPKHTTFSSELTNRCLLHFNFQRARRQRIKGSEMCQSPRSGLHTINEHNGVMKYLNKISKGPQETSCLSVTHTNPNTIFFYVKTLPELQSTHTRTHVCTHRNTQTHQSLCTLHMEEFNSFLSEEEKEIKVAEETL